MRMKNCVRCCFTDDVPRYDRHSRINIITEQSKHLLAEEVRSGIWMTTIQPRAKEEAKNQGPGASSLPRRLMSPCFRFLDSLPGSFVFSNWITTRCLRS